MVLSSPASDSAVILLVLVPDTDRIDILYAAKLPGGLKSISCGSLCSASFPHSWMQQMCMRWQCLSYQPAANGKVMRMYIVDTIESVQPRTKWNI